MAFTIVFFYQIDRIFTQLGFKSMVQDQIKQIYIYSSFFLINFTIVSTTSVTTIIIIVIAFSPICEWWLIWVSAAFVIEFSDNLLYKLILIAV